MRVLVPALAAALLSACGSGDGGNDASGTDGGANSAAAATPQNEDLTTIIQASGELERFRTLVATAGLADVLGGVGPYTVFAPTDAAVDALGQERVQALTGEAMRPQAAALLRAHIVPGTLTRRDLQAAIEAAGGQPVRMRTMAGPMLTFARDGEAIVVLSEDGARARLTDREGVASNGAVQPVDAVLRRAG